MSGVEPYRVRGGIMAPWRAEAPDGSVGTGWSKLTPADPEYRQWDQYLRAGERRTTNTTKVKSWVREAPR